MTAGGILFFSLFGLLPLIFRIKRLLLCLVASSLFILLVALLLLKNPSDEGRAIMFEAISADFFCMLIIAVVYKYLKKQN